MAQAIITALAKDRTKRYADVPSFIQAVSTKKTAEQWLNEGNALGNSGRFEEELQANEAALRLNPNYAMAHYGKGVALATLERYQEALQAFETALRLNPNDAEAYQGKGFALEKLGKKAEAQLAFDKAKELGYKR